MCIFFLTGACDRTVSNRQRAMYRRHPRVFGQIGFVVRLIDKSRFRVHFVANGFCYIGEIMISTSYTKPIVSYSQVA